MRRMARISRYARSGRSQKGWQAFLLNQLQHRFGNPPAWVREKMANAHLATLDEWGLRILDANSLDEVFAC